MRFQNKTIIVTGAARGIGLATAVAFAEEGGTVIATDSDIEALEAAVAKLEARKISLEPFVQDVSRRAEWDALLANVIDRHGQVDVLVNNAGIHESAQLENTSSSQWERTLRVNLDSVFHGMQSVIEVMKEHGGAIVNVSSICAQVAAPELAAYGASKAAISQLSRTAAVDCARNGIGIRINSVHPGFTDTAMVDSMLDSLGEKASTFARSIVKNIPLGRLARPHEIAKPILFLASEEAAYITGTELVVDGGYVAT